MKRIKREHRLDPGMRGWIVNTSKKNIWRVAHWYDLSDLIQDGFMCYAICHVKYMEVKEQKHFMALVKTTFYNFITDLANEKTQGIQEVVVDPDSQSLVRTEQGDAFFVTMLGQLPVELQQLIKLLLQDGKKPRMKRYRDGTRETTNEHLCRLLGVDPKMVNIMELFKEHMLT